MMLYTNTKINFTAQRRGVDQHSRVLSSGLGLLLVLLLFDHVHLRLWRRGLEQSSWFPRHGGKSISLPKERLRGEEKLVMVGAQLPIYISLGGQTCIVGPTPTLCIQVFTLLVCYCTVYCCYNREKDSLWTILGSKFSPSAHGVLRYKAVGRICAELGKFDVH